MSPRPARVRIRLLRKLADRLDGIDVSGSKEGDVLDLPRRQAELLIAEQWALPYRLTDELRATSAAPERVVAAERSQRRASEQRQRVRHKRETETP